MLPEAKPERKTLWMTFCESTSIKGVGKAVKASTPFLKISWVVCVLFGASMTSYLMYRIISQYVQYQTATSIKEIMGTVPPFPDVTICKINPSPINFEGQNKHTVVEQFLTRLKDIENKLLNLNEPDVPHTTQLIPATTHLGSIFQEGSLLGKDDNINNKYSDIIPKADEGSYTMYNTWENEFEWDYIAPMEYKDQLEDTLTDEEQISTFIAPLQGLSGYLQNADLNDTYSESVSAFVTECLYTTWNGRNIDCEYEKDTYQFYSTDYPACFTFHPKRETQFVRSISMISYLNDFFDVVPFDKDFTVFSIATKGVKVFLHPRGSLPNFDQGVEVGPGVKSSLLVEGQKWSREPAPYSNCFTLEKQGQFSLAYGFLYTEHVCVARCRQRLMLQECECVNPHITSTAYDRSQAPFCGRIIDNDTDIDIIHMRIECFMGVKDQTELCSQECPPPCDEYRYTYKKSDAAWPHKSYLSSFISKINNSADFYTTLINDYDKKKNGLYNDIPSEVPPPSHELDVATDENKDRLEDIIKTNFLLVNIQMDGKHVMEYKDKAVVSLDGLLSNIGGTLNLWIGITFVTLIELCEMCYHMGSRAIIGTTRNIIHVKPLNNHETGMSIVNGNGILMPNTPNKQYSQNLV